MWNSEEFTDKVLSGWERAETDHGIPYYINHKTERTQWDHPYLVKTLEELGDLNSIRYAAYRTSMKLIFLQKRLLLNLVDLSMIASAFDSFGARTETLLDYAELHDIMDGIFYKCRKDVPSNFDREQSTELLLNWLFNLYDGKRSGCIRVMSVKTALSALCSARLAEKYRYFFRQLSDHSNNVNKKKFGQLLFDLMQLIEMINESSSFGGISVTATVENCFQMAPDGLAVSEEIFINWMLKEPQTLVWLPTMHRMAAAESVKHESKCNICKAFPIVGLRYRCLKCFNFDMCQECFFTGRTSKKHKLKHPIQEYCLATTSKQDTKAFMKTVRNNFSKKHRNKNKPRYHPVSGIGNSQDDFSSAPENDDGEMNRIMSRKAQRQADVEDIQTPPPQTAASRKPAAEVYHTRSNPQISPIMSHDAHERSLMRAAERRELQDVIQHLEQENKDLLTELESIHARSETSSKSSDSDYQMLREERDRLEAKQEIIESHNRQLEMQLKVLRNILRQETDVHIGKNTFDSGPGPQLFVNKTLNLSPPQVVPDRHAFNTSQPLPPTYGQTMHANNYTSTVPLIKNNEAYNVAAQSHRDRQDVPSYNDIIPNQMWHKPQNRSIEQINPDTPSSFPPKVPNLPLHVDTTYGSIDGHLGYTHFTLPSPSQSRFFYDEEKQLDELIDRLDSAYPANYSRTLLDQSEKDDLYNAANRIGDAMTDFVGQFAKPEVNESEA